LAGIAAARPRRSGSDRAPRWTVVLFSLALFACGGGRQHWSPSVSGPGNEDGIRFRGACSAFERGEVEEARTVLAALAQRHPDDVAVGVWLQEAQIALAGLSLETSSSETSSQEAASPGASSAEDVAGPDPLEPLRARYRAAAEADPTPARLVLAARLEPDLSTAADLLDRALDREPGCAWAHYGKAFLAMRSKSWHAAREAIARALEADPGHLRTRRLQAVMLARGGAIDQAVAALEAWIEYAGTDPTIERSLLAKTQLDLALLLVVSGEPERGRRVLEGVHSSGLEAGRRYATLAACEQALSQWRSALEAAERAEELAPGDPLSIVQQALLHEYWLDDPEAASAAWERVLEASGDEASLAALLQRTRARVRVERNERARARDATAADRTGDDRTGDDRTTGDASADGVTAGDGE